MSKIGSDITWAKSRARSVLDALRSRMTNSALGAYQFGTVFVISAVSKGAIDECRTKRAINERGSRTEELRDAPERGLHRRTFSHRDRYRSVGSLLRKGLRRS